MTHQQRDHGGGVDAAIARYGGLRSHWIDLSTGIAPFSYPLPILTAADWSQLPDRNAHQALVSAARIFWNVPKEAAILPAPGASSLIANIPRLTKPGQIKIPEPTYNEHKAAFDAAGWNVRTEGAADARVLVQPNNPDGKIWDQSDLTDKLSLIDESFADAMPDVSLMEHTRKPGVLILKSFGKFWALAGLRLGFLIGDAELIKKVEPMLGPWPVSGPALKIGTEALRNPAWADHQRQRLRRGAKRLDDLLTSRGAKLVGGTPLFRLYDVKAGAEWQDRLAQSHIWSRVFPYNPHWLRLGLPADNGWERLEAGL
ncbi:MAG: threonine-phosphate decarboxylase [Paracoccaceae bacterium]